LKKATRKLLIAGSAIILPFFLFFLAAETGLRLVNAFSRSSVHPNTGRIGDYFYDDENGCFRIKPNSTGFHLPYQQQEPIRISINSQGFRGPELKSEKSRRLIFIGDSIVFNAGVPQEQTFTALLEEKLNADLSPRDKAWECLNLGTTDAGVRQYFLKIRDHALELKPEAVIIGLYLNDSRPPQGFLGEHGYQNWEKSLRKNILYKLLTIQHLHRYYRQVKFSRNHALLNRFRWVPAFVEKRYLQNEKEWQHLVVAAEFDWGAAWQKQAWSDIRRELQEITQLCRDEKVELMLFSLPVSAQVEIKANYQDLDFPQQQSKEMAEELGIPFLDLLPEFRQHRDKEIFYDQCHLTATGNQLTAKAINEWLKPQLPHSQSGK